MPDEFQIIDSNLPMLPRNACYDGNFLIKKANIKIRFSEEHIEEIIKCSKDVIYFAENYVTIVDPDKGKTLIVLREYQKRLLKHLQENRFSILLLSRQSGKSLISSIFILWYSLYNKDKASAILANKQLIARSIFDRIKLALERLPFWMQPGIIEWNAMSMKLENGSSIFCSSTSSTAIRGITISGVLFLDEFAFLPQNIADEFFSSVFPTISASEDSKVIVISTPNGLNHYHSLWKKAEAGKNSFKPFRINWDEVPGRDKEWLEKMKRDIGDLKVAQEICMSFLGSSKTLILSQVLEDLESVSPINITDSLKIYEESIIGHFYVIGVDSARGTGGDYSTCQVLDLSVEPIKQVAVYRNNTIGPRSFGKKVADIGRIYNNAYLVIENNNEGCLVTDVLWNDEEYENIVDWGTSKNEIGIRATSKSKTLALDVLKEIMEAKEIEIIDQDTIYELSKFTEERPGIFKGLDGENDDLVSALYWALFITSIPDFYNKESIRVRNSSEISQDEEPIAPILPSNIEDNYYDDFQKELLNSYK